MPTTEVGPGSALELQSIADAIGKAKKVIVITGAGISTNCGIPDFRSEGGLYSLIQAQYDAALQNPPWQDTNTFDIDDRPKKKRKGWFYEVVAPDGEVVDVLDEENSDPQDSEQDSTQRSRSRSAALVSSRSSSPITNSTDASSVSCALSNSESAEATQNIAPFEPIKNASRRSSRRVQPELASADSITSHALQTSQPEFKEEPATSASSTTNSPPPSRASSQRRRSATNALANSSSAISHHKEALHTRTRVLQREESSILSSASDEENSGLQSSQSSTRSSLPNLKGRDLFDSIIWSDPFMTSIFYMFISTLRQKIQQDVKSTTETHRFIRTLRDGGRLVRNYTQNIDCLEEREGLNTDLTRGPGNRARFSHKTFREPRPAEIAGDSPHNGGVEVVLLHGGLVSLRCGICAKLSSWDEADRSSTTLAGQAPDCPACTAYSASRTGRGRRGLAVGRLRPDIVLYGEEHPNAGLVSPLIQHDLGLGPDVLLIMGTSLKVHGLKVLVKEFAKAVHTRGGKVVFVNRTKPPESTWGDVIDYWVSWDCDQWVLDLKRRRGDLWLPQGSAVEPEKRHESTGETKTVWKKRPQATRDDKMNGVFVTFKILDTLGKFSDRKGKTADRYSYWPSTVSRPSVVSKIPETAKKPEPAKKPHPVKKAPKAVSAKATQATQISRKRKSYPNCLRDDKRNVAHLATKIWADLRKAHPSLPLAPPEITQSILQERCKNLPSTAQKFAFNSNSNHMPNFGGQSWGGLDKISLITHPPSGASIPVHTPKTIETAERKPNKHAYGTRLSRRHTIGETIVVDSGDSDTIVVHNSSSEDNGPLYRSLESDTENRIPTPPESDPLTPSARRIKRIGSIGAILSSPEESEEIWHDAPEVIT